MNKDNVVAIKKPERFVDDPISDILRQGARDLLAHALEVEIEIFLNQYKDLETRRSSEDRAQWLFARTSDSNGIGPVPVEVLDKDRSCRNRKGYPSVQPYCRLPAEDQKHGTIDSVAVFERCFHRDLAMLAALVGKDAPVVCPTISRSNGLAAGVQQWQKRNLQRTLCLFRPMVFTATFAWMINSAFWSLWVPLLMV